MAENENPMRLFLLLISCFLTFRVSSASTTNTLHQADTLNSSQTLISAEGKFTLGFFNLKSSNKNYLCIWYTSSPTEPVWIANRNTPIPDDSGVLTIENTGKFLIKQDGGDSIELYSGETASNNSSNFTATLHDNGNFVLSVVNSDGSNGEVLWQSFDYPTDTLLPGMKLGVNLRTSKNWTLASRLSERDPSSGPYTLDWDSKGVQLVLKRRGVVFWTSGILKDQNQTFENVQKDSTWFENYNLFYDRNSDEQFFSYFLKNDSSSGSTNQTGSRWKIGFRGTVWFEDNGLPLENMCYGYNTDSGCAEWTQPECRSNGTTFVVRSGDFVGLDQSNDQIFNQNESIGPADCRANCWNDCDCLGYRSNSNVTCIMWRGKLQFKPDSTGSAPSINVINNRDDNIQKTKEGKKKWILVATIVPISLILAIIGFIVLLRRRHIKGNDMEELDSENDGSISGNLKVFSFVAISEATNGFSAENKLGEGGFGPVFKGKLPGGQEVAVKQLASTSKQGVVEFKNELALIGKLQHTNLVRLIGCCVRGEEKMLVYEYMPNKSLDSFIFDKSKRQLLDWRNRVNIIEGIAQGLLYLHQHSRLKIIHRDLKASNILLDVDMNPKISDFGIARIFKQSELMARTNKVIGTYGYMSPEYAMEGIFSIKSDVFSFGVLVLEILSGRKNNRFYKPDEPLNLVGYAWELWQNGDILDLMDPILKESCYTHELVRYIHVGLLCVEDSPADRPTISEVISMLANENIILPLLKKPAFLNLSDIEDSNGTKLVYHSENGFSFSTMEAR